MRDSFLREIEKRRSIYALSEKTPLSQNEIEKLVEQAVKYTPSAFNSQSARVVVLFEDSHKRLWKIVEESLKKIVPEEKFGATAEKLATFAKGVGTVLFFEEADTVQKLQKKFPLYAENFPLWSLQSNGMLEFAVWCAFSENQIGASLQHYNPLIDEAVRKEWNLPETWKLLAEMPFGGIIEPAGDKDFLPIETRVKVFA